MAADNDHYTNENQVNQRMESGHRDIDVMTVMWDLFEIFVWSIFVIE